MERRRPKQNQQSEQKSCHHGVSFFRAICSLRLLFTQQLAHARHDSGGVRHDFFRQGFHLVPSRRIDFEPALFGLGKERGIGDCFIESSRAKS